MAQFVAGAAPDPGPDDALLRDAIASGDPSRAMPALAGLREVPEDRAIPLLLLGLEQEAFLVRSLACAGLGVKRNESGWLALERILQHDHDPNVRAEAANSLASYGVERCWPLLRAAFAADRQWLVRCSILSALAEQPLMAADQLLDLARMAVADGDGTVRVGGAEILGRLMREGDGLAGTGGTGAAAVGRALLLGLLGDGDHRVVAVALDCLQA
jgi:hypothetical protein